MERTPLAPRRGRFVCPGSEVAGAASPAAGAFGDKGQSQHARGCSSRCPAPSRPSHCLASHDQRHGGHRPSSFVPDPLPRSRSVRRSAGTVPSSRGPGPTSVSLTRCALGHALGPPRICVRKNEWSRQFPGLRSLADHVGMKAVTCC